jgi:hypothetical protein
LFVRINVLFATDQFFTNMKVILTVSLSLLSIAVVGQSDEIPAPPRALFKVAPQNFVENTLKVGVEVFNRNRSKSYSLYLYGRLDSDNNSNQPNYYGEYHYKGLGTELQYRKYISPIKSYTTRRGKNYLQGIYVSGYLQGASYGNDGDFIFSLYDPNTGQRSQMLITIDESTSNVGTGFTIGVHRTLWNVLFIDAYIGGGVQWSDVNRTTTPSIPVNGYYGYYYITDPGYQGIMPKFGLQVGIVL